MSNAVVDLIVARDQGACARCGTPVSHLTRGIAWSVHHRRARGMGGSRDAWINEPANGVVLCGSGTTGCHGDIEKHRDVAYDTGWLIRRGIQTAESIPLVHAIHGYVYLDNMGGYERLTTTEGGGPDPMVQSR
ncbi:HNH endonuclease [Microbacterium plantarum]|uniref:HNH endonuclease n=1 Tax=Microbacterium plantarum TaxID=1816425 RepID=UPI002B47F0E8|nr:hypothetical protein [Microbacterium plantarum]WRK16529.1 hypothetical protein VC184_11485 [Microbacterium plantarum]